MDFFLSIVSMIIAFAAFILSLKSFFIANSLKKGSVNLLKSDLYFDYSVSKLLNLKINIVLKNFGKEPLKNFSLEALAFFTKEKVIKQLEKQELINEIPGDFEFAYPVTLQLKSHLYSPKLQQSKVIEITKKIIESPLIIILNIYAKGSIFKKDYKKNIFLSYKGYDAIGQATMKEYDEIKQYLPERYKI